MPVPKDEFLKAYEMHAGAIYRHCFFRVFRKELAEELMQETFMKTWRSIRDGQRIENIRAFLYKVATNLIIDESRKKREESLDAILEADPRAEPASSDHLRREQDLALKDIIKTFDTLDEESRKILTLRYVDDIEPKDIGEILDISANYVSVKINRALTQVKKAMNPTS